MGSVRTFHLRRHEDASGVSGIGRVAEGVVFPDGKAVLWWHGPLSSIGVYDSIADVEMIHGHGGMTEVVFDEYVLGSATAA